MEYKFAKRMAGMQASAVREILKVTQRPEVISFAGGLPAPELFPVEEIGKVGEQFNPDLHNAVMHIEDDAYGEGVVVEEFEKGFCIGDRVLRYSVVKVAN